MSFTYAERALIVHFNRRPRKSVKISSKSLTLCVLVCVCGVVEPVCVFFSVSGAGTGATGVCVSRQVVSGSARLRYKGPHHNQTPPLPLSSSTSFPQFPSSLFLILPHMIFSLLFVFFLFFSIPPSFFSFLFCLSLLGLL